MTTKNSSRTIGVRFSEEQAIWIEAQVESGFADKGAVIKSAIDRAMTEAAPAQKPAKPEAPASTSVPTPQVCGVKPADLRAIAKTVDILLKKYMADHPASRLSNEDEAILEARWNAVVALRSGGSN